MNRNHASLTRRSGRTALSLALVLLVAGVAAAQNPPMIKGDGWAVDTIFTVSQSFGGYQPAGILDGVGAFPGTTGDALILVNHELGEGNGYAYQLANGTSLVGARVTALEVSREGCRTTVHSAGLAYDAIYDRSGAAVTSAAQVNETGIGINGLARLCSAQAVRAGTYGFVDDIFFTGEETGVGFHPHGGTEWALDVQGRALWPLRLSAGAPGRTSPRSRPATRTRSV